MSSSVCLLRMFGASTLRPTAVYYTWCEASVNDWPCPHSKRLPSTSPNPAARPAARPPRRQDVQGAGTAALHVAGGAVLTAGAAAVAAGEGREFPGARC